MASKRSSKTNPRVSEGDSANGGGRKRFETETVTFRIPLSLKEACEKIAIAREITTTRFVIEALMSEINNEPPRWWTNWHLSKDGSRSVSRKSAAPSA